MKAVYEFEQTFVAIGIVVVLIGAFFGMRIFGPGGREVAELHETGETAKAARAHQRLAMYSAIDAVLVLFAIWAMVTRLGL